MHRALALAALAQGCTSPNPLVGALVLDARGRLIGEGYHARAGRPHAEVGAPVSYTHLRAHETGRNLVCRLLLEKKKKKY